MFIDPYFQVLLEVGGSVNKKNRSQQTPLHLAAQHCTASECTTLLAYDASPNMLDCRGYSPLHAAAASLFANDVKSSNVLITCTF